MTLKEEILTVLSDQPADHSSLYQYLERNPSTVRKELHRLKEAGKIVRHSDLWHISAPKDQAEQALIGWWEPILAIALIIGAYLAGRAGL